MMVRVRTSSFHNLVVCSHGATRLSNAGLLCGATKVAPDLVQTDNGASCSWVAGLSAAGLQGITAHNLGGEERAADHRYKEAGDNLPAAAGGTSMRGR